jgi:hypothetical protein
MSALREDFALPPGRFLVLISVRGRVDLRAIVRLEGLGKFSNIENRTRDFPACISVSTNYSTGCLTTLSVAILTTNERMKRKHLEGGGPRLIEAFPGVCIEKCLSLLGIELRLYSL